MDKDFPILELPETMQRALVKKLAPAEAIEIAIMNPDFRQILSKYKLHATKIEWKWAVDPWDAAIYIQVDFEEGQNSLRIDIPLKHYAKKTKTILGQLDVKDVGFRSAMIDNNNTKWLNPQIYVEGFTDWQVLEVYTIFILDLVRADKFELHGEFGKDQEFLDCFLWKYCKKFSSFHAEFHYEKKKLKHFKFLNEQLEVESCYLQFKQTKKTKTMYKTPISARSVVLNNANFLHPDSILQSNCSSLALWHRIMPSIFNSVVRKWQNGEGMENLKEFEGICESVEGDPINDKATFDGIATLKTSKRQEIGSYEKLEDCVDVLRSTDRARATICFDKRKRFRFWVHEPKEKKN